MDFVDFLRLFFEYLIEESLPLLKRTNWYFIRSLGFGLWFLGFQRKSQNKYIER